MTVTGAIVGSYQILERLGTGGMGEVYRARHLHLDRQAAIKMLLMELSQDREAVDRFFAEAQATSLIHHPGIVEIFDCNVHESGRVFLVMELLEGETLAERMRRDPDLGRDLPLVLGIADQIADALGAAHARGIVHRDLKPENVFLVKPPASQAGGVPRVKVLDFGIAKLLNSRGGSGRMSEAHTLADRVLGTPAYMSPEQCRDARSVDHRTDVYSLGCVLFEMIAGHLPFQASTFGELVAAQLWETPPALPGPASKLVARMLAKDPSWRLQDMGQVRSEIARVLRRARSQAGAGGLADLRLRWESFWNERMSSWLPQRVRPAGRWMGSLLSSRRQLVGIGVGWALIVS
ncbi:MAG TPA: serine/threonine-protein kinase, partial [Polyangia bacterium]